MLDIRFSELEDWPTNVRPLLHDWLGGNLLQFMGQLHRPWSAREPSLWLDNFVVLLQAFFDGKTVRAYRFEIGKPELLYFYWGGVHWEDVIFTDGSEHFLLHFDLSD